MTVLISQTEERPSFAVDQLVKDGHVHRDVYTSPDIFDLEMRQIFGKTWIYVAHESQLKAEGDFVTAHMGTQGIIVSRDEAGDLQAIFNRCTHRGSTLCGSRNGNAPRGFQCPYHGWIFGADGALKSVPFAQNYDETFNLSDYDIQRVPCVESYRGFVFANLDPNAPALVDFLGHMRTSIDDLADRSPSGEVEVSPYVLRHYYRANWKMTFENLNDVIHPGFAHAASVVAARKVAQDVGGAENLVPTLGMMMANGKPISFFHDLNMVTTDYGHSYIGGHMGANYSAVTQDAYFNELAALHGKDRAQEVLARDRHLMLLYPSSTWHARYQTVRIVRPVRHDLTEVIGYVFRLKGAPEETFRNAIEYCNGANSAASPVIADDLEIYERCLQGNSWGGQDWIPMVRGLSETREPEPGTKAAPATSEAYIRNQFRAWASYMEGAQ